MSDENSLDDEFLEELMEVFRVEAEDTLNEACAGLDQIQQSPDDRVALEEVRRAAHTLKGAAACVGLNVISQVAHRMEDLLDQFFDRGLQVNNHHISLLLRTTDTLEDLIHQPRGVAQETLDALETEYSTILHGKDPAADSNQADAAGDTHESNAADEQPTHTEQATPTAADSEETSVTQPQVEEVASSQAASRFLRVPVERMDAVAQIASELVTNRLALEQRIREVTNLVQELSLASHRIRDLSERTQTRTPSNSSHVPRSLDPPDRAELVQEFDPLEFDHQLGSQGMTEALNEAAEDLDALGGRLRSLDTEFEGLLGRQGRLARETQEGLMRVRMVSLDSMSQRLQRAVRTAADALGKHVQLTIEGQDIELDKAVLDEIGDALIHMLRNAVDHGIESNEDRVAAKKSLPSQIHLRAVQEATRIILEVSDDGRGLNRKAILEKALSKRILTAKQAEQLSDDALLQLIFRPGFSTAKQVSQISGRGVGMDIVMDRVRRLSGNVRVKSKPGQGTTFTIHLPTHLSIMKVLLVDVGGDRYAVPMYGLSKVVSTRRCDFSGRNTIVLESGGFPVIELGERLGHASFTPDASAPCKALLVDVGDRRTAFLVDHVAGAKEVTIKDLGIHLGHVPGVAGATILGDGSVVPVLELSDFRRLAPARQPGSANLGAPRALRVLFADDSLSIRRSMTRIITAAGWEPIGAKDGQDVIEILSTNDALPDIILLDLEMPRMNGLEVLASLRSKPDWHGIPAMVISSRATERHKKKAMDLGASAYIVKPFQEYRLLELINELTHANHQRESMTSPSL